MSVNKALGNINSVVALLAQSVAALLPIAPVHADAKAKIATGLNDALSLLAETETLIAAGISAVHDVTGAGAPAPAAAETDAPDAVAAAERVSASRTGEGAPAGSGTQTFPLPGAPVDQVKA